MPITIVKPTVGGSADTWGQTINDALDGLTNGVNGTAGTISPNLSSPKVDGTVVTSSANELNSLSGFSGTSDDLNYAKSLRNTGVTASEFDVLDGATANLTVANKAVVYGSAREISVEKLRFNNNFQIQEINGKLIFMHNGSYIASMDDQGNVVLNGNITAFGVPG